MKTVFFLVVMCVCSATMAQESDTCEIFTEARIIALYDTHRSGKTAADTSYYHTFFYVPNNAKLQEMGEWARQQGFEVSEKVIEEEDGDRSRMIFLEKQIMHDGKQQLTEEIQRIVAKRKNLLIFKCNGSGLGGGNSSMASAKKGN
jgi:hypothetical protein